MYGELPIEYYTESGREVPSNTYIPGEDFDPYDADDVAAVQTASEWDRHNTIARLEAENARLRNMLENDEPDWDEHEEECMWDAEQSMAQWDDGDF